jgi:hypothetical protein
MAIEIKPPTQEEKDAVLYDLVMAKRVVTHIGGGIHINSDGRRVNPDGSELVASQPSTAAAGTIFSDPSGKKYMLQGSTLVELVEAPTTPPASISTPNQVKENASVNQASGRVEPNGFIHYADGTYSDPSGRRFNTDGTPYIPSPPVSATAGSSGL